MINAYAQKALAKSKNKSLKRSPFIAKTVQPTISTSPARNLKAIRSPVKQHNSVRNSPAPLDFTSEIETLDEVERFTYEMVG